MKNKNSQGFSLIELIVAVGLFALIMLLVSGAYFVVLGVNREVQGISTGIDNLAFALETMTRTIRTGTNYKCGYPGGDCPTGLDTFSVTSSTGSTVTYSRSYALSNGIITQTTGNVVAALTDPTVNITKLTFYANGTSSTDDIQPRVTIVVEGQISSGPGKTISFVVETGATMRATDI